MTPSQNIEGRPALDTTAQSAVIGFTPVNGSGSVDKGDGISPLDSKSSPSTRSRKRKQSQVLGSTVAEETTFELVKPIPATRSSKTKIYADQRISQRFKGTKPILPKTAKSSQRRPDFPSTETLLAPGIPNMVTVAASDQGNKADLPQMGPTAALSGLADKYQTACLAKRTENMLVDASGPLSQEKVPVSTGPTLSTTPIETSEGNDALYPASAQSLQSAASEPRDLQDNQQMKWNDDEFPLDDDGIQEMMILTEIKQSTSNLAFHDRFHGPCLNDEENFKDLRWLEDSFCLDMQYVYNDHEDLHKVVKNRSNPGSPPSSISNVIQCPRLASTNYVVQSKMNDLNGLGYVDRSFDDDDLDFELLEMTEPLSEMELASSPLTKPATPDPGKLRTAGATVRRVAISPEPTRLPTEIPWMISFDAEGNPKPFIRPSFPKAIRDRSPILGLTPRMVLRTCFRIGEALNAASAASRSKADAIIELYARVYSSERELGSFKQFFQFSDLFTPEKPPFLAGSYGLWRGLELWDLDSKAFLGEKGQGKMARAVGRIRREERSQRWQMTILSVWPVSWDDVGIAKGIVLS